MMKYSLFLNLLVLVIAQEEYDVIIVGAGYAGLAAGKYFHGHKNFLILEANDYIGGRIKNAEWYGQSIPLGAGWIHHPMEEGNIVTKLAQKYKLDYYIDSYDANNVAFRYGSNGTMIPQETTSRSLEQLRSLLSKMEDLSESRKLRGAGDVDVKTGLRWAGFVSDTPLKNALEFFLINFENGIEPNAIGAGVYGYTTNAHEWIVKDSRGYSYPVLHEAQRYIENIKLKKQVTLIERIHNHLYNIHCSDGSSYKSNKVLVTVSSGVLQSKSIKFEPPLPDWKIEALSMVPMCHYCKIFLRFETVFWDNDKGYIMLATERKGHYVHWQNFNKEGLFPGSNTLMVTLTGDICQESYTYTDDEIMEQAFGVLRNVYPDASRPIKMLRNDFSVNPNFRGSYSYQVAGIGEEDYLALEHPIQQSIYFAGEAYTRLEYGYTHSAYQNGWETAKSMTKCMRNEKHCPSDKPEFVTQRK